MYNKFTYEELDEMISSRMFVSFITEQLYKLSISNGVGSFVDIKYHIDEQNKVHGLIYFNTKKKPNVPYVRYWTLDKKTGYIKFQKRKTLDKIDHNDLSTKFRSHNYFIFA